MITFLCWYFGISVAYTIILYLTLTSHKVFCLMLEHSKDTHFNAYLNLRAIMLYIPITMFTLNVLVFPLNFVSKMLAVTLQVIEKSFVNVAGSQEEKYRPKRKHNIKTGGGDNK